jgi:hypothetical protein
MRIAERITPYEDLRELPVMEVQLHEMWKLIGRKCARDVTPKVLNSKISPIWKTRVVPFWLSWPIQRIFTFIR